MQSELSTNVPTERNNKIDTLRSIAKGKLKQIQDQSKDDTVNQEKLISLKAETNDSIVENLSPTKIKNRKKIPSPLKSPLKESQKSPIKSSLKSPLKSSLKSPLKSQKTRISDENQSREGSTTKQSNNGNKINDFGKAFGIQMKVSKFKRQFSNVFNKTHMETFGILTKQIDDTMEGLDDKMKDTMYRKQFELLQSFQTAIQKMAEELKESQEKYRELEEVMHNDKRLVALEKHLNFFRDQCCELKEIKEKQDKQLISLKSELEQEKNEKEINRCALLRTEEECQGLRSLLESKQEIINQLKAKIQISNEIQNNNEIQSKGNLFSTQPQFSKNSNQNSSRLPIINKLVNNNNNQDQQYLREQQIVLEEINQNKENFQMQQHLLQQYVQNKFYQKDKQIQNIQSQLDEFQKQKNYEKQDFYNNELLLQQNLLKENELKTLFQQCVQEAQQNIQKKQNNQLEKNNSYMNTDLKNDRYKLFSKFLSSNKFLEIIKKLIFEEQCCNNQDCSFNINGKKIFSQQNNQNNNDFSTIQHNNKQELSNMYSIDSKNIQSLQNNNLKDSNQQSQRQSKLSQYGNKPSFLIQSARDQRSSTFNNSNGRDSKLQRKRGANKSKYEGSQDSNGLFEFYNQQYDQQKQLYEKNDKQYYKQVRETKQAFNEINRKNKDFFRQEKLYEQKLSKRVDLMLNEFQTASKMQKRQILESQKFTSSKEMKKQNQQQSIQDFSNYNQQQQYQEQQDIQFIQQQQQYEQQYQNNQ